jgi:hypothetical protein
MFAANLMLGDAELIAALSYSRAQPTPQEMPRMRVGRSKTRQ